MRRFIINGKFLRAESTGVHRVAIELCHALAALQDEAHPAVADMRFELLHTADGAARAAAIPLPRAVLGPLTGIPWEQLTLPLRKGPGTLLNLCNIGPVASGDAVTMIHDAQVHLSPQSYSRGFRLWYRLVQPMLGRRNRAILTVSAFSKAQIAKAGIAPADRIHVVHNGVDHIMRVARDAAPTEALGPMRGRYVVALSTTQAHKNIAVLMRAFADPRLADIPLVLVGGAGRQDFAQLGVVAPNNVHFAGRVSDGGLRALMEDALCLAFPSTTEGFGLPPLEAMAVGCPAIVAPCGALPEMCGDAVIYAPPDDAGAWVAAIAAVAGATEVERARTVAAGRSRAGAFTWRRAALRLAAVLAALD